MEITTRYKDLVKIVHKLYCDDCKCEMEHTDIILMTYPAKYQYICPQCGKKLSSEKFFPWEEITGIKCYEDYI